MAKKGYYEILLEDFKILDFVKRYQQDFTKYNKEALEKLEPNDEFILAARESGTNIHIKSDMRRPIVERGDDSTVEGWDEGIRAVHTGWEQRYFYGHDGMVEEIKNKDILPIIKKWIGDVVRKPGQCRSVKSKADLTPKENQILFRLNDLAKERVYYGTRVEKITSMSVVLGWSNGSAEWFVHARILIPSDGTVTLDANEIIYPISKFEDKYDVQTVAPFVDTLPLYKYSLEAKCKF